MQLNLFKYTLTRFDMNIIEIPLTSKKRRQTKFCLVDEWSQALLFTGEKSFSCPFFYDNPEISAQIQKPINTSLLPLLYCESWIFVRENPDSKENPRMNVLLTYYQKIPRIMILPNMFFRGTFQKCSEKLFHTTVLTDSFSPGNNNHRIFFSSHRVTSKRYTWVFTVI